MYVYIYIYIHIYTHVYIYIYIYIYIYVLEAPSQGGIRLGLQAALDGLWAALGAKDSPYYTIP